MSKRNAPSIRTTRARVSDSDRKIYQILREEFTAADLQKYTEIEPLIPAEQVLADLEKNARKKKARKKS